MYILYMGLHWTHHVLQFQINPPSAFFTLTNDYVNVANVIAPQVPSEDWGGGYGGGVDSGGEIPCRRMRSGSYIKAMGDDDSADSDTSPKASPKSTLIAQRDAFRRSISMDQRSNDTNAAFIEVLKGSLKHMPLISI